MAGVDGGDAEGAHIGDERVLRVVGVEGPELGLHGGGLVQHVLILGLVEQAGEADGGMRVDQAGRDDLGVEHAVVGGISLAGGGADVGDLAVAHQNEAVLEGGAGGGVDRGAVDGERRGRGVGRGGGEESGGEAKEGFHCSSPWLAMPRSAAAVKQHKWARRGSPAPGPPTA